MRDNKEKKINDIQDQINTLTNDQQKETAKSTALTKDLNLHQPFYEKYSNYAGLAENDLRLATELQQSVVTAGEISVEAYKLAEDISEQSKELLFAVNEVAYELTDVAQQAMELAAQIEEYKNSGRLIPDLLINDVETIREDVSKAMEDSKAALTAIFEAMGTTTAAGQLSEGTENATGDLVEKSDEIVNQLSKLAKDTQPRVESEATKINEIKKSLAEVQRDLAKTTANLASKEAALKAAKDAVGQN